MLVAIMEMNAKVRVHPLYFLNSFNHSHTPESRLDELLINPIQYLVMDLMRGEYPIN